MANIVEFYIGSSAGTNILNIPAGRCNKLMWKSAVSDPDVDVIPGQADCDYWDQGSRRRTLVVGGRLNVADDDIVDYINKLDDLGGGEGEGSNQYEDDDVVFVRVKIEDTWLGYNYIIKSVEWSYPPGQPNVLEYTINLLRVESILTI